MPITPATLSLTDDGTPFAPVYDDVYHSRAGAIAQARHVFLAGNDLPARWSGGTGRRHFVIVETGFGLGLNFLTTWATWRTQTASDRCQRLHFISVEKHPLLKIDLQRLLSRYQSELPRDCIDTLVDQWPALSSGMHRLEFEAGQVVLTLILGDAETALNGLNARADAIYLDGFSPAKNPDIWSEQVCQALARLSGAETTLATWSVSGLIRRRLSEHGFNVSLTPGFAQKREMLHGRFRERRPNPNPGLSAGHALIIGAGLAGTATAERLAARGWRCTILEANTLASGASGNTAGIIRPLPSIDDNVLARLTRAGFHSTLQRLQQLSDTGLPVAWQACGVLHLARDASQAETMQRTVMANQFPENLLQWVGQASATNLAHLPLSAGGWWFPTGGWVNPADYCRQLLVRAGATLLERTKAHTIRPALNGWRAEDGDGNLLAEGDIVVLANAAAATALAAPFSEALPIRTARGQITKFAAPPGPAPQTVVCRNGYWTPAIEGMTTCGASFIVDDLSPDLRSAEHAENLATLSAMLSVQQAAHLKLPQARDSGLQGRVGWRPVVPDRLPLVGPLPSINATATISKSRAARARVPGLYVNSGFGARGILFATLCAEVLACQISGEPMPLENDLLRAIDPIRYAHKKTPAEENPNEA
jgi:tRNA 5-methylaminomethyl-2-thiouridine biosynthesis bifunctional protein